ncbi:hypothetical protein FACS1894103_3150 [Campylobacterota bacterium]|nr:hypothetical protein FACS1894103_3150 [Campylobacterota bacterium]
MTSHESISRFFYIYSQFLKKDIFNAVGCHGRQDKVIAAFIKPFELLIEPDGTSDNISGALDELEKIVDFYLKREGQQAEYLTKTADCPNLNIDKTISRGNSNHLYNSQPLYNIVKHFVESLSCVKRLRGDFLSQAIVEFNNALSHLYMGYKTAHTMQKNTNKSITHIYRGTLDNYKSIIKEHSFRISDSHAKDLMSIRCKEMGTIGGDTKDKDKIAIIEDYRRFIVSLPLLVKPA